MRSPKLGFWRSLALGAALLPAAAWLPTPSAAQAQTPAVAGVTRKQLLRQPLPRVPVAGVLLNEVTLAAGQSSPDHHHPGEVYTYVLEGEIRCQLAGQPPLILRAGDSFREAAGQRVLAFDNNSAVRPCRFLAFYLLKDQQPPIVLTTPPTQPPAK
jgi:quercetin dioxygenase-like cupin family protein